MSISFQSTSASSGSRNDAKVRLMQQHGGATNTAAAAAAAPHIAGGHPTVAQHPGFLGGIFHKRERKLSKSDESGGPGGGPFGRSTEV